MIDLAKLNSKNLISFHEVRPNAFLVETNFFHGDGDMVEVYIKIVNDRLALCDYGVTLMRLSYVLDLDTENKMKILLNLLKENQIEFKDGEMFYYFEPKHFAMSLNHFIGVIYRVATLEILKRESVVKSLFYDNLKKHILHEFQDLYPKEKFQPIKERKELIVDFVFDAPNMKKIFLFGAREENKAKNVIITCYQLQKIGTDFISIVVNETTDCYTALTRNSLMDTCDKQFSSLEAFSNQGLSYIKKFAS